MSRVLLFVDGPKGPRCFGEYGKRDRPDGWGSTMGTRRQRIAKVQASRWWLVQCENADFGREVIRMANLDRGSADHTGHDDRPFGVILAAGGHASPPTSGSSNTPADAGRGEG